MIRLTAPEEITSGQPIPVAFEADERVAGRVRITAGETALPFRLERGDRISDPAPGHRVRGRRGNFRILDWGEHAAGTELVLRFEGAKVWMTVAS